MGNRIHALAQSLIGKASLDECSLEEVKHIVKRYPFFAPAQFLLLQKLKQLAKTEEEQKQHRKAVLFYHDPLLFEHYINSDSFYKENSKIFVDQNIATEISEADETVSEPIEEIEINGDPIESIDIIETNPLGEDESLTTPSQSEQEETLSSIDERGVKNEEDATKPELPATAEPNGVNTADEPVKMNLASQLTSQSPSHTDLTFEPFHTVDYFASQGIKISQDELPKDKLGKQLKSFTEWLKTMKRLPATQTPVATETSAEKNVESMASHSVSESNVVTEAMAEVWVKQGNTEKALEIFNKLSLLNPSKKAYFAAKIENLKQS